MREKHQLCNAICNDRERERERESVGEKRNLLRECVEIEHRGR